MRVLLLPCFVAPVFAARIRNTPGGDEFQPTEDLSHVLADSSGNLLKYSFRVDEKAAQMVSVQAPIFDLPQNLITSLSRPRFFTDSASATDSAELANENSRKLNLNLKHSPFNLAAQRSTDGGAEWEYKTYRADRLEKYEKYHITSSVIDRTPYLTSAARDYLLNNSPENIERSLGTFYATSLRLGALLKFSHLERMSWKETEQSMAEKFDLDYKGELGADTGIDGSYYRKSTDESRVVRIARLVVGGDAIAWFGLKPDSSNLGEIKERWSRGVTDANLVPVELNLAPIWTLLEGINSHKAASIKSYFESKWAAERQALPLLPPGPHLARCNWKETSFCYPGGIGALLKCPNEDRCTKTGSKFCWLPIPGLQAECDCNSLCWQDSAQSSCCPR